MRVPATWRKSSYSTEGQDCVEIALDPVQVGVRDTKDRTGGELAVNAQAWRAALARLQRD